MRFNAARGALLAGLAAACLAKPGTAQPPAGKLQQILPGARQSSGHVIDLMLRYGRGHAPQPTSRIQPTRLGHAMVPTKELGDLILGDVVLLHAGNDARGPRIAVMVGNESGRDVGAFYVSLVAVFGRIHPFSPTVVKRVESLAAGQSAEIHLDLPVEALAMGHNGSQPVGYTTLVVAIDSYDQLVEANESNNFRVIKRSELPRPAAPLAGNAAGAAPSATDPVITDPTVAAPNPAGPPNPTEAVPPAGSAGPLADDETLDLDQFDLEPAATSSLFSKP